MDWNHVAPVQIPGVVTLARRGDSTTSIELPDDGSIPSATRALHSILATAVRRFPEEFWSLRLGERHPRFRRPGWASDALLRFEILRASSGKRVEIAALVADLIQQRFVVRADRGPCSLEQWFGQDRRAMAFGEVPGAEGRPVAQVDCGAVVADLERSRSLSEEASAGLRWALEQSGPSGDLRIDLAGERFVLLGGTAELSPLPLLLGCGADVLTTHTSPASLRRAAADRRGTRSPSGRLFAVDGGVDLLSSPAEFAESAISFAGSGRVHVGVFAYRGGEAREWRLAAVMDAILRRLQEVGRVASVTYYLSPSIATEISPATARLAADRASREQTLLTDAVRLLTLGSLFRSNLVGRGRHRWARSFVPRQGVSYQAGNLFGKNYVAEVLAMSQRGAHDRVRVSANVAPITSTQSTDGPQAKLAFSKLGEMGITVFEPWLTRRLMFLLMIRDLFGPVRPPAPVPFPQQVHGGVFTNAWALNSVLQLAYLKARAESLMVAGPTLSR